MKNISLKTALKLVSTFRKANFFVQMIEQMEGANYFLRTKSIQLFELLVDYEQKGLLINVFSRLQLVHYVNIRNLKKVGENLTYKSA